MPDAPTRRSINLGTDVALALATVGAVTFGFATVGSESEIPLVVHAALSAALVGLVAGHLALHWRWVRGAFRRLAQGLRRGDRARLAVDLVLGAAFGLMLVSGVALALSGARSTVSGVASDPWLVAHHGGAKLLLVAAMAHLALNRAWIARNVLRLSR